MKIISADSAVDGMQSLEKCQKRHFVFGKSVKSQNKTEEKMSLLQLSVDIFKILVYNNHRNKETKKNRNKIIWIKPVCLHIMIRRANYVRYNCNER